MDGKAKKKKKGATRSRTSARTVEAERKRLVARGVRSAGSSRWHTGYDLDRDGVTQSLLKKWQSCRVSAAHYLNGWRAGLTKGSLSFGNLWHFLDAELHKAVAAGKLKSHKEKSALTDFFAKTMDRYERQQLKKIGGKTDADQLQLDMAKAEAIFLAYCDFWPGDFERDRWLDVETVFDVRWHGRHTKQMWRLRGRKDGAFQTFIGKKKKREKWLLETKTKGRIDNDDLLTDALSFDMQNLTYLTADAAEYPDDPAIGTLQNIVRNPGQKFTTGTLAQYMLRVKEDVRKRPEHYFKRFEVAYPADDRERFEDELEMKLFEFRAWLKGDLPTYRQEQACVGRWNCTYLGACASGSMAGYSQTTKLFEELED
jgi:hypothetical protein